MAACHRVCQHRTDPSGSCYLTIAIALAFRLSMSLLWCILNADDEHAIPALVEIFTLMFRHASIVNREDPEGAYGCEDMGPLVSSNHMNMYTNCLAQHSPHLTAPSNYEAHSEWSFKAVQSSLKVALTQVVGHPRELELAIAQLFLTLAGDVWMSIITGEVAEVYEGDDDGDDDDADMVAQAEADADDDDAIAALGGYETDVPADTDPGLEHCAEEDNDDYDEGALEDLAFPAEDDEEDNNDEDDADAFP